MKTILKRFNKKNSDQLRRELALSHITSALLSISVIMTLSLGIAQPITFDMNLSAFAIVLLIFVTLFSLCVALSLFARKK